MATATGQLLEAQGRLVEWQAEDARQAQETRDAAEAERRKEEDERRREFEALEEQRRQEARRVAEVRDARRRDALAAEERRQAAQRPKIVAGSGTVGGGSGSTAAEEVGTKNAEDVIDITSDAEDDSTPVPRPHGRRASAIRAGKRKAIESDAREPETTPRAKRLRRRAGNTEDAREKTPPPPAPLDVSVHGEYNPEGKSNSPGAKPPLIVKQTGARTRGTRSGAADTAHQRNRAPIRESSFPGTGSAFGASRAAFPVSGPAAMRARRAPARRSSARMRRHAPSR